MANSSSPGIRLGGSADMGVLLAVVLMGGLLVWAFWGPSEVDVERSAMGSRGLETVLRDAELDARYAGFETLREGTRAFRVLPVLDTSPSVRFVRPDEDEDYLKTGTERDLSVYVMTSKVRLLPTLVIAPKWTRAARHSGYAHESLLLPADIAARGLAPLGLYDGPMQRAEPRDYAFRAFGHEALLYAPQLFPEDLDEGCVAKISVRDGPLLIRCEQSDGPPVWALSDPDLLNSHGLALAQNADVAVAMMEELADGAPILIDTTDEIFVIPRERELPARSWADLARFFAYPFSLAWGGLALMMALVLWRSGVRFGPARRLFDDRLSAGRAVSIAAKARLLRQAGNDTALMERHVANRLRRIERALFGHTGAGKPDSRIIAHLERADPQLSRGFADALDSVRTSTGERALEALADFEQQAGRIVHGS